MELVCLGGDMVGGEGGFICATVPLKSPAARAGGLLLALGSPWEPLGALGSRGLSILLVIGGAACSPRMLSPHALRPGELGAGELGAGELGAGSRGGEGSPSHREPPPRLSRGKK